MSKCFTVAFLVISTLLVAQTRYRTVSGRLTDKDNGPLPGVNVSVKGTANTTTTDANGNYSLEAPVGGTIVFSFIGMKAREMRVGEDDLVPISESDTYREGDLVKITTSKSAKRRPPFILASDSATAGVAILNDNTPTYSHPGVTLEADKIRSIKRSAGSTLSRSKTFRVKMAPYIGYSLQFTTAIGIENITQTPSLQGAYVQGRPQDGAPQWRGPEYQEIFSWGPALSSLRHDGSSYPYDQNGRLVPTGNGTIPKGYDASTFFRTGFNTAYSLHGTLQRSGWGTLALEASHKNQNGVIPNARSTQDHIMFQVKKIPVYKRWTSDVHATYDRSDGKLVNRGGNYASIVGAVWRTPASFDNTNGLSPRGAVETVSAARLADGTVRAHAPLLADNPYGLVQELPDKDLTRRFISGVTVRHNGNNGFNLTTGATFEKQWNDVVSGVPPGLPGAWGGRIMNRHQEQTALDITLAPAYIKHIKRNDLTIGATYHHHYQQQSLHRHDGLGFLAYEWGNPDHGERVTFLERSLIRSIHELSLSGEYTLGDYIASVKVSSRSYFSNTLPSARYTNFFPHILGRLNLEKLLDLYDIDDLSLRGSFARSLREAPLLYSNWSYLSTRGPVDQYNTFYEASELFFNNRLLPEMDTKMHASIDFSLNHLNVSFALYNNITNDFIAPRWTGNRFEFTNVGRVKNYGTTASVQWFHPTDYRSEISYKIGLHWSRQNTVVKELYSADAYVPVAGFATVAKVLAEDKPLGAIYGTRYQRNVAGQVMIGDDGFPLVDPTMTMIGNPIPDWTGDLDLWFKWRHFELECIFDIRKGGDVWNGTRAALDYLGRSATTGDERHVYRYIFPGVDPQGDPNVTPVSFYDPTAPLAENRWVRYGFEGVGEAYMEDASWIRLQEVTASYTIHPESPSKIHDIKFSFIANNVFLITGYSGVDPASSLLGYTGSTGLDLFNTPATRSFTAKMTIKL